MKLFNIFNFKYKLVNMVIVSLITVFSLSTVTNANDISNKESDIGRIYGKDRFETNSETIKNISYVNENIKVSAANHEKIEDIITAINHSIDKGIPFLLYEKEIDKKYSPINLNTTLNLKNAIIVNDLSDLITALSYAVNNKCEIIYNDGRNLPDMKKYKNVLVVGGVKKVQTTQFNRIAGDDRYETNRLMRKKFGYDKGYLVSGENIYDAISSINMILKNPADIILTKNDGSSVDVNNENIISIIGGAVNIDRKILYINPHQDDEILTMGLQLLRDIKEHKNNVHLILLTDGSETSTITKINIKLMEEGFNPAGRDQLVYSRNTEMRQCLTTLGMNPDNILFCNYRNLELKKNDVLKEIEKFKKRYKNIELRTMSANEYDTSYGNLDHLACKEAVEEYSRKNNIRSVLLSNYGADILLTPEDDEKTIILNAARSYSVYEPSKNRFAVGYNSVRSSFMMFEQGKFVFGVNK